MAQLLDLINQQLSGPQISQLSQQLGISEDQTRDAIPAALAALTGAMASNAARPQGAQQLAGALSRDHDGSILDNLGGFLGSGNASPGVAILKHVLGGRQPAVESQLGRTTGLDPATMTRLLALLAPLVLGYLGRKQRQQRLDPTSLPDVLGHETRHMEQTSPQARKGLGALLDADGDGQIADDLAKMVGGMLAGRR